MRDFFAILTRNPISLGGSALTTASFMMMGSLFGIESFGYHGSPYVGILTYLILPAFFIVGLLLIPLGIFREKRRAKLAGESGRPAFPVLDLNRGNIRRNVLIFLVLTVANIIVLATATYKGVEVMDSTAFCGATCHTVMQPEYTAYQGSPHSRVNCVECHIGPGADWFVKSKLSGAWQVVAVTFDLFPRPIPTPIENLRPARETCEQCHWPTKFVGDRLKVITRFQDDEQNTELKTVLLLRVGGIEGRKAHGIHWHVDPEHQIRYRSDPSRETIYEVELTGPDGDTKTFLPGGQPAEPEGQVEWRVMDCVDCHNRPTHIYQMPADAVDRALQEGRIDPSLPYVKREGLSVLEKEYASHDEARQSIEAALRSFYGDKYPDIGGDDPRVVEAAGALGDIYGRNVFPEMNVTWGTYPNHIGHFNFEGCFRCHNDDHATTGGEAIAQDCDTCHTLLAMEEPNPEILAELQP